MLLRSSPSGVASQMTAMPPVPAAQYLRMSTDQQRYSIQHQSAAIAHYAAAAGFEIVKSYEDAGRSGVTAKGRKGLSDLLRDVMAEEPGYSTILVLDVSRWGRYQNPDEAAHYEFLCRSNGVDIRYCGEDFGTGLAASVFKHLKRVMAGEYSREMSVKIRRAKQRTALSGMVMGGTSPYGFSRQIVNKDGTVGAIVPRGVRKPRADQQMQLVPEGREQSAVLRRIFRLFLRDHRRPIEIATLLNARQSWWLDGTGWTNQRVRRALRCELVTGRQAFGKSAGALGSARTDQPRSRWTTIQIFPPIVSHKAFATAQARLAALEGSRVKTDAEMLADLKAVFALHGRISLSLIDATPGMQRSATYFRRFGTVTEACRLSGIAYEGPRQRGRSRAGNHLTRDEALAALRRVFDQRGRIDMYICQADATLPSLEWLRREFGSLHQAFNAAGLPFYRSSSAAVSA